MGVVKSELVRASERQAAKSGGRRDAAVERMEPGERGVTGTEGREEPIGDVGDEGSGKATVAQCNREGRAVV